MKVLCRLVLLGLLGVVCNGQAFRYDADESGVELPEDCSQVLRYWGKGVQRYICTEAGWKLSEPLAYLHQYLNDGETTFVSTEIAGYHFFTNPGTLATSPSGPGWTIGKGCDLTSCDTVQASWVGRGVVDSQPQGEAIAHLLVERSDRLTSGYGLLTQTSYLQRLKTIDGLPPTTGCDETTIGTYVDSNYQCDYIFSVCDDLAPVTTPCCVAIAEDYVYNYDEGGLPPAFL